MNDVDLEMSFNRQIKFGKRQGRREHYNRVRLWKAQDEAYRLSWDICSWNLGSERGGWDSDGEGVPYNSFTCLCEAESRAPRHLNSGLRHFWEDCLVSLCLPGWQLSKRRLQCSVPGSSLQLVCSLCSQTKQMSVCFFWLNDDGRFSMMKIQFHIFWNTVDEKFCLTHCEAQPPFLQGSLVLLISIDKG